MHALISKLARHIVETGGEIHTETSIERIVVENGAVRGVIAGGKMYPADAVISTIPSIALRRIVDHPDDEYFDILKNIDYIGVMCALLRLKRPMSRFFWTNISDPEIPLAELSNTPISTVPGPRWQSYRLPAALSAGNE